MALCDSGNAWGPWAAEGATIIYNDELRRETTEALAAREGVPERLKTGLLHYVVEGQPTGDFLRCCLENRLYQSVIRADPESLAALVQILACLYYDLPDRCWGSPDRVRDWLAWHAAERAKVAAEPQEAGTDSATDPGG